MVINQGDVFWLDLGTPYGSAPGYRHPHVVIQNNVFNHSGLSTVVLCLITSNLRRAQARGNVLLRKGEANLSRDSVVNITQIITVDKSKLVEKVGTLSTQRMRQVIDSVRLLTEPRNIII